MNSHYMTRLSRQLVIILALLLGWQMEAKADGQRQEDKLVAIEPVHERQQGAILSDGQYLYRLCNSRPQRLTHSFSPPPRQARVATRAPMCLPPITHLSLTFGNTGPRPAVSSLMPPRETISSLWGISSVSPNCISRDFRLPWQNKRKPRHALSRGLAPRHSPI